MYAEGENVSSQFTCILPNQLPLSMIVHPYQAYVAVWMIKSNCN